MNTDRLDGEAAPAATDGTTSATPNPTPARADGPDTAAGGTEPGADAAGTEPARAERADAPTTGDAGASGAPAVGASAAEGIEPGPPEGGDGNGLRTTADDARDAAGAEPAGAAEPAGTRTAAVPAGGEAPAAPYASGASAARTAEPAPGGSAAAEGAGGPGTAPGHGPGAPDDVPTGRHAADVPDAAADGEPVGGPEAPSPRRSADTPPEDAASVPAGRETADETDPRAAARASGAAQDGPAASDGTGTDGGAPVAPESEEAAAAPAASDGQRDRASAQDAAPAAGRDAGTPVAPEGGGTPPKRSAVAEALAAAVRAVESGERSAASFFTEPARPAARAPRRVSRPAAAVEGPVAEAPVDEEVLAEVRRVLAAGGAPEGLAGAVVTALGEPAAEALREDPWLLLGVAGVRPEQADGFARALLGDACGPDDARRARALTSWLLERAALAGHTVLEAPALREELARRAVPDPDEALREVIADGTVLVFQEPLRAPQTPEEEAGEAEVPVRTLFGLDRYAMAEESLADGLARLLGTLAAAPARDWEGAAAAAPSPSAAELIRAVAASGLVAHSGGEAARAEPAAVVAAARALGLRAVAAAFTEDGRRRLAAAGDAEAVTVAGLLAGREGPERDAEGTLPVDVLAVLDAPRLDVETAAALVESLPDGARLILSGDPAELWSAGPGRVFADVLAARACPVVVSRTPDPGPLGELLSGIGAGELLRVGAPGKEVVIVPVRDAGEAVHRTVQLVADSVPRAIGIAPEATQVVTVGHGGPAGTRALNAALKERLNPGPGRFGGFDPGDRIAYVPAPGRMVPGTVVSGDAAGLRLDCSGTQVVVPPGRVADAVRHGWAVTAHQAAGTRWPAAVVVLPGDAGPGLTRSWVYTAFGRGERHLSVVHGAGQDLPRAVAESPAKERSTRLRTLLKPQPAPAG
ncbi:helix-hairpin-helix domain-containing protein [Streptomyces mobaraensis]|uniref:helix-hairpin-helix domain-containing protein n=1 Tax=Streptomyces mobaraensis TaxID=35621 RepID=UPI0033DAB5F2